MKRMHVANRAEIACCIIQAAHGQGIEPIAVYSDADKRAKHCEMADFTLHIGASPAEADLVEEASLLPPLFLTDTLSRPLLTGAHTTQPGVI